jgi:hypothetical protein
MSRRQLILLGAFFLVAAALAFYLQDIVDAVLFVPASYLWWAFNLLYQSVAQVVYWILLVVGVALMAFGSLYGVDRSSEGAIEDTLPLRGPLEATARQIARTRRGMYYKWLIANRMGKLARSILTFRNGQDAATHGELNGRGWNPSDEVAAYLMSGLTRTFADFPRRRWLSRPPESPFDIDLDQVVTYLESQMENQRD